MAIHHLLNSSAFGPEEIQQIVKAYDDALSALGLSSRDDRPGVALLS
jgi:hypothetical protein